MHNNVAFVIDLNGNKLSAIDVSIPSNPTLLSSITISSPHSVTILGSFAYIGTGVGFAVVDISTPASMTEIGSYLGGTPYLSLDLKGPYVYATGSNVLASHSITSYTLFGLPNPTFRGDNQILIHADDNLGGNATDSFIIYVNMPPVVANKPSDREIPIAVVFNFTIPTTTFFDEDNSSLVYTTGKIHFS